MHVWLRVEDLPFSARIGGSAGLPSLPTPSLSYSLDVNALNFCRFSLLNLPSGSGQNGIPKALISLPNLIDSSTVCYFLWKQSWTKTRSFCRQIYGVFPPWRESMLLSVKRSRNLFSQQILVEEIPQVCIHTCILVELFPKRSRYYHVFMPLSSARNKSWTFYNEFRKLISSHRLRKWECRSPRVHSKGQGGLYRR